MILRRLKGFSFGIAGLAFIGAIDEIGANAQAGPRIVVAKFWNCVLDHASSYRELTDERIIVIYLPLCPTVRPSVTELAGLASNLSDVPEFTKSNISNVLIIPKAKFDCVLTRSSQIAKFAGKDPELGDLLQLDVDACKER